MDEIEKIEKQITVLENRKDVIKANRFKEASKSWFTLLHAEYESSSTRTKQYLTFCRVFKRQFKKLLNETFDIAKIEIAKPNHFDQYGYFELKNGNIYYFSVGDLRWRTTFLLRTAISFTDSTGGSNNYCNIDDFERFMKDLKSIVDNSEIDKNLYSFPHEKCGTSLNMATKKEAASSKCEKCKKPFSETS
jgi:hypothetical protein